MFYVRRQLLTDDSENIFFLEAYSVVGQFKNSCSFCQQPFYRTTSRTGRPQMLFITVGILFARVANVQSITELVFMVSFGKKTNFCHALLLLQLY